MFHCLSQSIKTKRGPQEILLPKAHKPFDICNHCNGKCPFREPNAQSMLEMSDHQLFDAISMGHESAMAQLYERYKSKVYNTALSYLQSVHDAEEVTQDVFIQIFRSAGKFEGRSAPNTWIYRIAINQCLDRLAYLKRQKRSSIMVRLFPLSESGEGLDLPYFEHPGVILEQKESTMQLFKAIAQLPEQQKSAFILSFIEGMPRQEVADTLETSLKAVESLLQRAKAHLRLSLEKLEMSEG